MSCVEVPSGAVVTEPPWPSLTTVAIFGVAFETENGSQSAGRVGVVAL